MTSNNSSINTKDIIEQKFKELVCKKPLSKVTVSEIIKECNINRKTFYYYFDDIYALLKHTLKQEAINIAANFDYEKELDESIKFIVDYIEKNKIFLKNVFESVRREELKRFFFNDFSKIVDKIFEIKLQKNKCDVDSGFKEFAVKFYTEAIASSFVDLITDTNTDNQKTIKYLSKIINNAVL